jgi:hypothetical protein
MTGTVYHVQPIPAAPDRTTYLEAGVLTFGVEYRLLDDAELKAAYQGSDLDEIEAAVGDAIVDDNGVSIHVFDTADGHEYLRFDCFRNGPHYHYIERDSPKQTIVEFDAVAHGDMIDWTLARIERGLTVMLAHAGAPQLAERLDQGQINAQLPELERLAREAQQALDAQL